MEALARIEGAIGELRRRERRRSASQERDLSSWGRNDLALLRVLHAVEELGAQATVSAVAALVGIDQSGASRLTASAADAGYLRRLARDDGRSSLIELTDRGSRFVATAHDYRRGELARATDGWSDHDRLLLAELLANLVAGFERLDSEAPVDPLGGQ